MRKRPIPFTMQGTAIFCIYTSTAINGFFGDVHTSLRRYLNQEFVVTLDRFRDIFTAIYKSH